jgi:hypothetical protein
MLMRFTTTDALMAAFLLLLLASTVSRALGPTPPVVGLTGALGDLANLLVVPLGTGSQTPLTLVRDIFTILAIVVGGVLAMFTFGNFSYPLALRLQTRWLDEQKRYMIVHVEIESKSKVRVSSPQIQLQVLEYDINRLSPEQSPLPRLVPFRRDRYQDISASRRPKEWKEPQQILTTTTRINPGEIVSTELVYRCPKDTILHIGLRVEAKRGFFDRFSTSNRSYMQTATHVAARLP